MVNKVLTVWFVCEIYFLFQASLTHISVCESVCVCCLAQWQKLSAVHLSRTVVCYASSGWGHPTSILLSPVGFDSSDVTHEVLSKADTKNLEENKNIF